MKIKRTDVPRILNWLQERGGIAVWESKSLSYPGRCYTPANILGSQEPTPSPHWKYGNTPARVITDRTEITVYDEHLFKMFPVSLRRGGNGWVTKLTDSSMRKLNKVMAECEEIHGNAHWIRGVMENKPASMGVFWSSETEPL